jgi:hypothetical protein
MLDPLKAHDKRWSRIRMMSVVELLSSRDQYARTRSLIFQVRILNWKWIETLNMGNAEAY